MKKFMFLLVCLGIIGFVWFLFKRKPEPTFLPTPKQSLSTVRPSPVPDNAGLTYLMDGQTFHVFSFIVNNPTTISLIPNLTQKSSSYSVAQNNQCNTLTSGGFYSKDNKPIGLFKSDGKQISAYQPNTLFNGFFSINVRGNAIIGSQVPDAASRLALQSGPLLITDGIVRKLSIRDDEPARRIVTGQTINNAIIFLVIYSAENTFKGPKLADLPKHIKKIEKLLEISITNALNLDGGSASAFIMKDHSLTELTPVGSFFCVL